MSQLTRREFLQSAAVASVATGLGSWAPTARAYVPSPAEIAPGDRPAQDKTVQVLHPRGRVPLSYIIDDSTCLVNMGAFCMPQFRNAWPQNPNYWKPWKDWPREIPSAFVQEFGDFVVEQGVRGKYSLIPYPACVGWLDRELPGWSKKDLEESLRIARVIIAPHFDLTPEMITHTHVIDLKTNLPITPANAATMENSYPPQKKSADELAQYIAHALRVLKNCDLPCTGVTTPGGFGNKCKAELSVAMRQALSDVFAPEIPFYFKYIVDGSERTHPRLEQVEGVVDADGTTAPKLTVNVPAGTGDWFGNWDGDAVPQGPKYLSEDGAAGRMAELIARNEPAVMFGHWAGLFSNGSRRGFEHCKKVITTLNATYRDRTLWMKSSEMARYQAARELTRIECAGNQVTLAAPFACPSYTLRITGAVTAPPKITHHGESTPLKQVNAMTLLMPGTWLSDADGTVVCFDLAKGRTVVG